MSDCTLCHKPIVGLVTETGDGFAHPHCHARQHQPQTAQNLFEVARGVGGEPLLAAQVINDLIPEDIAREIVKQYNRRLLKRWEKRCEEPT